MELEELRVYNIAMEFGEKVWNIVIQWDYFTKDTIGKQLVKATDSIAANLSEGFGRYHYKETKNFGYYSRGSLYETKTWLTKANNRKLIQQEHFEKFIHDIEIIGKMLNKYIKAIGLQTNAANEPFPEYPMIDDKSIDQ
ncbi:MAG: four helix bundle protein [Bacteroidetes bacterium]|nr:four helix bundle protein [Bacteroidota bacterium]